MLNNLVIIGKVTNLPWKLEINDVWSTFEIQLERPYKDRFGKHVVDNFQIKIWKEIIKPFLNLLKVNHLVIIRGRLEVNTIEVDKTRKERKLEIIADYLIPLFNSLKEKEI